MQRNEALALTALVVYVTGELLFRYSAIPLTYTNTPTLELLNLLDGVAIALSITTIALKPHKMTVGQALLMTTVLSVLIYSANQTGDFRLVHGLILIVAISCVDLKRILYVYGSTVLIITIALIALSLMGIVFNKDVIPNVSLVFSFGFTHPNCTGALLFSALASLAFVFWNCSSWLIVACTSTATAAFAYVFLSSHTTAAELALLTATIILGRIYLKVQTKQFPSRVFLVVTITLPLIIMTVMVLSSVLYNANDPFHILIDNALHGRIKFAHDYFVNYNGLTLFGRVYSQVSSYHSGLPFASVDCGYCYFALVFGLAPLLCLIATHVAAMRKLARSDNAFFIAEIVVLCAIYLILEGYQLYIATGLMAIFLSAAFYSSEQTP